MSDDEKLILSFLLPFNKNIGLVQELRAYFINETHPAYELVYDAYNSVNFGYGFTEKAWDCYCAIIVYSKHINISFPSGAILSDPENLLIGTGSRVRHIKVKGIETLKEPVVMNLILQARDNAMKLTKLDPNNTHSIRTIIKPNSGRKNRPA